MPSLEHEALLLLFHNRPELAPELLRDALGVTLPHYAEVRLGPADLTEVTPTEYRADLVVLLEDGVPVMGIVVEVQLDRDERKRFTWPQYAVALRARLECPTCVLVITPSDSLAEWCAEPIVLGPGARFTPLVVGPSVVPRVTDESAAERDPELAMLSVLAHGREPEGELIARHALRAARLLDDERQLLYSDLVFEAVSQATRKALEDLMASGNYVFRSEFAIKHQAKGREEGRHEGRVEADVAAILAVLEERGLVPTAEERAILTSCTQEATLAHWIRKAVTTPSVAALLEDVSRT